MSRSDTVYLEDIREAINMIIGYLGEATESEFLANFMLQDAVIRRFEIIGEAATKISEPFKLQNPQIPWRLMKTMRNKMIHEYFGVSAGTIYSTIKIDIPVLKQQIDQLLS